MEKSRDREEEGGEEEMVAMATRLDARGRARLRSARVARAAVVRAMPKGGAMSMHAKGLVLDGGFVAAGARDRASRAGFACVVRADGAARRARGP